MFFITPYKDANPTRTFPFITVLLILINVLVFFIQLAVMRDPGVHYGKFLQQVGLVPAYFIRYPLTPYGFLDIPPLATLLTSMFLHGGFLHLIMNMLYLWIFGNNIEDNMGHFRFLFFYLICGALAGGVHAFANSASKVPCIGASGAIFGVLAAYMVLYPRARVYMFYWFIIFFGTFTLPAVFVIGWYFILQIYSVLRPAGAVGDVAFFAHIGGFVFGLFLTFILGRPERGVSAGRDNRIRRLIQRR